jgi:hypothetical protein
MAWPGSGTQEQAHLNETLAIAAEMIAKWQKIQTDALRCRNDHPDVPAGVSDRDGHVAKAAEAVRHAREARNDSYRDVQQCIGALDHEGSAEAEDDD